jgi:hypothetical protein
VLDRKGRIAATAGSCRRRACTSWACSSCAGASRR